MIQKYPLLVLALTLALLSAAAWFGATRFQRFRTQVAALREDFNVEQGMSLTLLGLLIGFTFSMALGRYDQRKNYEEEEANAIGTEYLRADLLPAATQAAFRQRLVAYVDQRILYYTTRDNDRLEGIVAETTRLQNEMWSIARDAGLANPNALSGLVVSGMNDVINTQGYTTAAWSNRIPLAAWGLMFFAAASATLLIGIGMRRGEGSSRILHVLPFIIAVAFFLISDIDSPRRGVIRVSPQNLLMLKESLQAP